MEKNGDCREATIMDESLVVLRAGKLMREIMKDREIGGIKIIVDSHTIEKLLRYGRYAGFSLFKNSRGEIAYVRTSIKKSDKGYIIDDVKLISWIDSQLREKVYTRGPVPAFIIDRENTILDANEEFIRLVKMKREDIVGKKCYEIMHHTNHAPFGCPLIEIKTKGSSGEMNIMETVFGKFLVVVREIAPGIYGHYAMRDAAVLYESQNRIIEMLNRYNRLLNTTIIINSMMISGGSAEDTLHRLAKLLVDVEEFKGARVILRDGHTYLTAAEYGDMNDIRLNPEEYEKVEYAWITNGDRYLVIPFSHGETSGFLIINTGEIKLSNDEIQALRTMAGNLAVYVEGDSLERKRNAAYEYMLDVIENLAILADRIRNPLTVIMATAEIEITDEKLKRRIVENTEKIKNIGKKIDELWNNAEKMRDMLKKKK